MLCHKKAQTSTAPERSVCLHLMFVLSVFTNQMYHSNIMVPSCWKSMSTPWKPVRNTEHRFDIEIDVVRGSITHNMCNFRYRICTGVITLCLQSYLPLQHRTHGFFRTAFHGVFHSCYSIRSALCDGLQKALGIIVFAFVCNHGYANDVQANIAQLASLLGQ